MPQQRGEKATLSPWQVCADKFKPYFIIILLYKIIYIALYFIKPLLVYQNNFTHG